MTDQKFNQLTIIIFSILLTVIVIFGFLSSTTEPHVRSIGLVGETNNADFINQKFEVFFNRPIQTSEGNTPIDTKKFINIEPQIEYNFTWVNNNLLIIPKQNLQSDTRYKLSILKGLSDIYSEVIPNDYILEFKTKEQLFVYQEKNYPGSNDKIIRRNVSGSFSEVLLEEENIKSFSVNANHLVAVLTKDKLDSIVLVNLKNKQTKQIDFQSSTIHKVDVSNSSNNFLYIYQDVKFNQNFLEPLTYNLVKIYNIDSSETFDFNPAKSNSDILDAQFSPDGLTILYRASDSNYFLSSAETEDAPIGIARFTGTGGFNQDGTKVVFSNYDPLETYSIFPFVVIFNSDRESFNLTKGDKYVIDPVFFNTTNDVVYSERFEELLGSQGFFQIIKSDLEGNKELLFQDETRSLELPKLSLDDKYLITEAYTEVNLLDYLNQRSFINQRKPFTADLIIIDTETKQKFIEIKNGINAIWLN
jgi:hypothetical protein